MVTKVVLKSVEFAGPKQTALTQRACKYLELAINTSRFSEAVRAATFTASWQKQPCGHVKQRTPEEVLQCILNGVEFTTSPDKKIDIRVQFEPIASGVIGRTDLGEFPIQTAYWFVNNCIAQQDATSLAAHFMHEWMHVAGFYHQGGNSARGDVPYVLGQIAYDIINSEVLRIREKISPSRMKQ